MKMKFEGGEDVGQDFRSMIEFFKMRCEGFWI